MTIRSALCFEISRRLLRPPGQETVDYGAYQDWRRSSLSSSWNSFSDADILAKDVLDFGCGDGALGLYLASTKSPRSVLGVDIVSDAILRAKAATEEAALPPEVTVDFRLGSPMEIPAPDESIDTLVAFDCLEHIMSLRPIIKEWHRVLRRGGKCLIEWFPYRGPWGPHMESLIPIPWAHVLFGERAMFRAAERIYDLPTFVPRHWDLDENGKKRPNKWRRWSSFKEQAYINQLTVAEFRDIATESGFAVERLDRRSFGGPWPRRMIGRTLMNVPFIGEYFLLFTAVELRKL